MKRGASWIVALALLGAGCSGGSEKDGGAGDLLDRLPSDARFVSVVDLAEVRKALDLEEDAGLESAGDDKVRLRFLFTAANGLPHLQEPDFEDDPIADALDIGQIEEAATGGEGFQENLTVVRTAQPAKEVLDRMVEGEYERKGDAVVHPEGASQLEGVTYGAAGQADGLLVLASDEQTLEAGLDKPEGEAPWRELIDGVDGAARMLAYPGGDACLTGIVGSDSIEPAEGEFLLDPSGTPDVGRVGFDVEGSGPSPFGDATFDEAEKSGDLLRVPFSYGTEPGPSPTIVVRADIPTSELYDCE